MLEAVRGTELSGIAAAAPREGKTRWAPDREAFLLR